MNLNNVCVCPNCGYKMRTKAPCFAQTCLKCGARMTGQGGAPIVKVMK